MKRKEEILYKYYTHNADGTPEISADDLLKAMEEYRLLAEEAAFMAGRNMKSNLQDPDFRFADFETYKASLTVSAPEAPAEVTKIRFIADSILEQFLPDDPNAQMLSFNIKTEGREYTVTYLKNATGYWQFDDYIPAAN